MKKNVMKARLQAMCRRKIAVPIMICMSILLTSCNHGKQGETVSDSEVTETVGVPEVKGDAQEVSSHILEDYEKCKTKSYDNLDMSHCELAVTSVYASELTVEQPDVVYEPSAALQKYNEYCEFFFGTDAVNDNARIFSSAQVPVEYPADFDPDKDTLPYMPYPEIKDHLTSIENNEIAVDSFMYRDIDAGNYLWFHSSTSFPHCMNKGKTYRAVDSEAVVSAWFASDLSDTAATVYNDGNNEDVKYPLLDGNTISVQEAIDYFEKEYLKTLPIEVDEGYAFKVYSVDVKKIGEDSYVYLLHFSTSWNGVSFDHNEEMIPDTDISMRFSVDGEAIYCGEDDIDYYRNVQFPSVVGEGEPYEEVYSLEDAIDIMSEKLTPNVTFEVIAIDYIYRGAYTSQITLRPWWRFVTYNPNDGKYYNVYVNAKDGDCNYFSYVLG